jgi:hypothetical protein
LYTARPSSCSSSPSWLRGSVPACRANASAEQYGHTLPLHRLRDGVSPLTEIMVVTRFFVQYFAVEVLFGVPNHFGKDGEEALRATSSTY